jgi:cell division control protein 6
MVNVVDVLGAEESLFTAPGVLDQEYLPRLLPYREEEQKYLAQCIKDMFLASRAVLIHGPPGVGKTACVRYIFRELREASEAGDVEEGVVPIYINCWRDNTTHKIVLRICEFFGIRTKLRSAEELLEAVIKKLKNLRGVAFAFDEIDQAQEYSFLYHFAEEIKYKTFFLVSSSRNWIASLDSRIRSRILPEMLEFRAYNLDEVRGILLERVKYAFVPSVWEKEALDAVIKKCYENGDLRVGLDLLRRAGSEAERDASRKINMKHVHAVLGRMKLNKSYTSKKLTDFGHDQKV